MMVEVCEGWRITSDDRQWVVEHFSHVAKTGKRAGEDIWKPVYYYPTFEMAVAGLSERLQRDISGDVPQDIVKELQRIAVALESLRDAYHRHVQAVD